MLLYHIDPRETKFLRLRLGEKGALQRRMLYLSTLKELALEEDRLLLQCLVKAKLRASAGQSPDTVSFQQIDLELSAAEEVLRLLVKTQRLYLDSLPLTQREGSLQWKGEALSEEACRVEAFLWVGRILPLSECRWHLALRETLIALVGQELIFASRPCSELFLRDALKGPMILEGRKRRLFFDEELLVEWKAKQEVPLEVLPELHLHDETGCFANLRMDYGQLGCVLFQDPAPTIEGRKRLCSVEKGWEQDLLEAGYLRKQVGRSSYYCPSDRVADALSLLLDVGWRICDAKEKRVVRFVDWKCSIEEEGNSLVLRGSQELQRALQAVKTGRSLVDLGDRIGWIDRKEALRLFGELIEEEWVEGAIRLPKRRLNAYASLIEEKRVSWASHLREAAQQLCSQIAFERREPGDGFQGTLLPYQQVGLNWLSFLHRFGLGGLLADEMGLGKTVQLLAFFSQLRTKLPTLIVAPTSLLYHWQSEFHRFLPHLSLHVHAGATRAQEVSDLQSHSFLITSYAILRQDETLFHQIEFEALIFDESNAIKNRGTQLWQVATGLQAHARFCISGTPIENRKEELMAQFDILLPNCLKPSDPSIEIQRKVRPFILRRKKSDVALELPEKIEQIAWVEMTSEQEAIYQEFQESACKRLKPLISKEGAAVHRMEILEAILRLRQISCDPRLVSRREEGAKLEQLFSDLEGLMEEGRKVLVYSQFTSMLDLVQQACLSRGFLYHRLDGSTPTQARAAVVQSFQEAEGSSLFLLSLKAGGVGLNLTAADYVLLLDPWWNEAVERQAIDRAHRIGRKGTVYIKRYLTPQSIEEKMLSLKCSKQLAADQLLDWGEEPEALTAEDWFDLLQPYTNYQK